MLAPGATFAHYRIEALLGQGGMGQVYLAFDEKLHRKVALKVLLTSEPSDTKRMVREARAAAAVEHPNKVTVYELGEALGAPYLAMEFINGPTFRAMVDDPSIAWEALLAYLLDVARALDAAHGAGLVHGDVKPENVMLRDDGIVKVLDFGIARLSTKTADNAAATATVTEGLIVGTAAYMAPEQVRGEELDGRCDAFAWGVMAFELLTGEHPWGGSRDPLQLMSTMLTKPPRSLTDLCPELPQQLSNAIARTLSPDREARFATMRDLVAELAPLIGQSDTSRSRVGAGNADETALAKTEVSSKAFPRSVALAPQPPGKSGRSMGRRGMAIAASIAGLGALLVAFAGRRALLRTVEEDVAPASTEPRATSSTAGDEKKPPLRYRCHPDLQERTQFGLAPVACGEGAFLWCDSEGHKIACCADGLVAAGRDGMCTCPPVPNDKARARGCNDSPTVNLPAQGEHLPTAAATKERVRACFRRKDGSEKRAWKIHFWLDFSPEGDVASVKILKSDAPDQEMQACALRELRGMPMTAPRGGSAAVEMEWDVGDVPSPAESASASP